ncbi:ribonuclease HI [Candidatus Parcubacteria bacterium]|nr:ribonuclease HI [Candidatus Parcubacteria bacterium]
MDDCNALNIFTDGSALKNPGIGGIGVRFVFPDFLEKDNPVKDFSFPGYKGATNNQMEIMACVKALEEVLKLYELNKISRIVIYTDSIYVCDCYKKAMFKWPSQKWKSKNGGPILNVKLWKTLVKNIQKVRTPVEIKWIKGHSKDKNNEAVDKLAKKSAKNPTNIFSSDIVRRRSGDFKKTEIGSVKMLGQRLKIKIITSSYSEEHGLYRLRYGVISKNSKYYNNVDFIYSERPLRPNHKFIVVFNKNNGFPQVKRVVKEI